MEKFNSLDGFDIKGRGKAFMVRLPEDILEKYYERRDSSHISDRYLDALVEVDSEVYKIIGIEFPVIRGCTSFLAREYENKSDSQAE